jgi:pimeloyl-ACP methyl ester carboxylesterase
MPERRTVEVDGKSVRLVVGGSGPPLLYLHSVGADVEWIEAHECLAARFTVHLPAHPGFAESTGVERIDDVFDEVLHYVDLLDRLGLDAVPVVGTSLGGWIAAEIAALYPHRVSRLVLVDAVGLWLDEAPIAELFSTPPPELARLLFHDQEHPIAQMMRSITSIADIPQEFALAQMKALEAAARIGWNPYMHDPKLERRLVRVTAPTLVLWGRQDGIVSVAHGERYRDRIRGARLEVLEACGHLPPIEKPVAFAEAALRFLTAGR